MPWIHVGIPEQELRIESVQKKKIREIAPHSYIKRAFRIRSKGPKATLSSELEKNLQKSRYKDNFSQQTLY